VPFPDANTVDFTSSSPAQTQRVGARIGELLRAGDLVRLDGDLRPDRRRRGVGKPLLAALLCQAADRPTRVSPT
jgi:GNAT superfamily N-acetyltransferase